MILIVAIVTAALHPPNYQEKPLPPYCQIIRQLAQAVGRDAIEPQLARRCRIFHDKEG